MPGDISQQLGNALAPANEYLHVLHENGNRQKLKEYRIFQSVSVWGNYFFEIAKLEGVTKLGKFLI